MSLTSVILAQEYIGCQAFMEGCLSIEWKIHTSTFLTKKQSPRRWTAMLVEKLWLVAFDMWEHRCNELHKNDLSNKVQEMNKIDISIQSLLQVDTIGMLPHNRRLFYITKTEILPKSQSFGIMTN